MQIFNISPVSFNKYKSIPNNSISFEARFPDSSIKRPKHEKPIYAYRDFAAYRPLVRNFGVYSIPVHNEGIGQYLKPEYTSESFKTLFDFAKKKGTFEYVMNPDTGFIKTSFINHKENPLMSDLIWITDTCNNMELIKYFNPELGTTVFNRLTSLYEAQQSKFDEVIAEPKKYKLNGIFPMETKYGVGHCFVPDTKKPHKWFALTRLESVGNYLQVASDLIKSGFSGSEYGYHSAQEIPDTVINAIANSVKYLKAINYPKARSCGAWEEQTFVNSLTSDTSIINQGFRKILALMYAPTTDKNILEFRERLINSKNGDVFLDEKALRELLARGERRIIDQPDIEIAKGDFSKSLKPHEQKALFRDYDAAMSFMVQTERLTSDVRSDSLRKLIFLKKLEKNLVRENGALRYRGDEYLNLDYHTLKNQWTDNKHKNEAEWFLVSEISCAYGAIVKNMIDHIKSKAVISDTDKKILKMALRGQTEYINRAYARIAPKHMTKSNGFSNVAYKVPEAYEAVTLRNGKIKYVPGAHTLTWAASSLHKASRMFEENLQSLENLNLD